MNVPSYRTLCIEIFKTINNLNPSSITYVFQLRLMNRPPKYKLNLEHFKNRPVQISNKEPTSVWSLDMELYPTQYIKLLNKKKKFKIINKQNGTQCTACQKNFQIMQYFWYNKPSPIKVFPDSKLLLLYTVNSFDSQILLVILIGFSDIQQKINLNRVNTSYKVAAFWFFRSVFSRSRTEYSVSLRMQSKCGKIWTRKTPVFMQLKSNEWHAHYIKLDILYIVYIVYMMGRIAYQ